MNAIPTSRRAWHWLAGRERSASPWDTNEIIREELFGIERLEQHARSLATAQEVTARPRVRRSLNKRLGENEAVLLRAYRAIAAGAADGTTITPAAEWLLDNYHLVEKQIRQTQVELPRHFYRQLPKLAGGPLEGYPRVFGMAWACVAHSDSRCDPAVLRRFVHAYQSVEPLTIGELWAIAISLRIVLIENLRRAAERIVESRVARAAADQVADRLLGAHATIADPLALIRYHAQNRKFSAAFIVQVLKRLRDQDPRVTPALQWLEQELAARGTNHEAIVREEQQRQGASNVTVRNIITSMRLISDVNWREFVEDVSVVDAELNGASEFASMDFATRNLYRSVIEELARGSGRTEIAVARAVLAAAARDATNGSVHEPGFYLLARGRRALEREIQYRAPLRQWPIRLSTAWGPGGYVGAVLALAGFALAVPLSVIAARGAGELTLIVLALLGIVPTLDLAVALVNRMITGFFGATQLPGFALREGIPAPLRTMVVVPTLLTTADAVEALIVRLEVHYLASADGEVYFALLSDWVDAATERADGDGELLRRAAEGIARLNSLHAPTASGMRFYLLHRRRVWSEGQRQWMGWERKRGKLHELNRLLRGATDTTFCDSDGNTPSVPPNVRFVITLDTDTRLPRETVRRLVGKLAHPLNQPRFDVATGRITEGYAVLQPRVTPSLPVGREGSLFQRVFSTMTGIDPYDAAASDVYQDLFGAGSYAGKGIYEVDAFEATLHRRVPDGSLLSHDLFEGTFARAGLASDVEVVEEFPSRYDVAAARSHRWARGDWQLLPWIFGRGDAAPRGSDSLPLIAVWKMLDNLRRTLSAPLSFAALLAGWLLPLALAVPWSVFVLATIALPSLVPLIAAIVPRRRRVLVGSHLRALVRDLGLAFLQILFGLTFLAHQTWLMLDAIVRTAFRLVTARNLLEWVTAAQTQLHSQLTLADAYRRMSASVCLAATVATLLIVRGADAAWLALPFATLWLLAPAIARVISVSPAVAGRLPLAEEDAHALRRVARRTWRYFETFITAEDHMLPPDNFQEDPLPVVAHRTSPTNLGLYLLCVASARDFGWIGVLESVERLEATLASMQRLQRHRGHFFNWYDTRDLRALEPRYVSTVDSGNLAAHLITLANACREWRDAPPGPPLITGIDDALQLLRMALQKLPADARALLDVRREVAEILDTVSVTLRACAAAAEADAAWADLAAQAITLEDAARALAGEEGGDNSADVVFWAEAVTRSIGSVRRDCLQVSDTRLAERLTAVENLARTMAFAMEFGFLFDAERGLLAIGYCADEGALDVHYYDLLASEARLASFFAIAKNDVPTRHWFRLGRSVTPVGRGAALISWSGSMFEYLMPSLVMRAPAGSLLEQTNRLVVERQRAYGASLGVPWGISESAYNARDVELTYQYSNFGVPSLGLKRGLGANLVIAPYATGLAAMIDPQAAVANFSHLIALGAAGRYGFHEALDYTPARVPKGAAAAHVRAFMAHHQGMTVVAIANVLFDGRMRARFHAEPCVQATELLLQERTPRDVSIARPRTEALALAATLSGTSSPAVRRLTGVHDATPQTHLLSNGGYAVMLTAAGSGYSRWRGLAITRWREDVTRDDAGSYLFLRDVADGHVWSAGYQPCGVEPDAFTVTFMEDRAEIVRRDGSITTTLQVMVSPEQDAEVRRLSIANAGEKVRDIEVTSYCELVLAPPAADAAHPAFVKLFVQTEYVAEEGVLLATRRLRDPREASMWVVHHGVVEGESVGAPQFETDRARFLGRTRERHDAAAIADGQPLSGTVGTVLDPVFALRYRLIIRPGTTAHVSFWTAAASSREGVLALADKQREGNAFVRAGMLAWTQAQVQLRHFGMSGEDAVLFQRLAGHVLYADASLRASSDAIRRGGATRAALWSQGISGDLPIVLLRIDDIDDLPVAQQLLRAHEYWQVKQLAVDLVILNERASSYLQELQGALETALRTTDLHERTGARGGAHGSVFVLRAELITPETRAVLSSVARVVLIAQRGSIDDQLARCATPPSVPLASAPAQPISDLPVPAAKPRDLEFFNGLGGFAAAGREYVVTLDARQATPAPWLNVIANPGFGFQVAAEGGGYTWCANSRENQLTAWSNDPVTDRPGEVLYVRDDETGELWCPTATPIRNRTGSYRARHGQGYSRFEHTAHGIDLELTAFVPLVDPIKICRLRIANRTRHTRRLSLTAYVEWVLGAARDVTAPFIVTEMDRESGAMFAHNPWNSAFATATAFADLAGRQIHWTADRREFLGRHGRLERPAALATEVMLSGRTGAGLDPCCALQTPVYLEPFESTELVFLLGQADSPAAARVLLERYRSADLDGVLREVTDHWDDVLGTIEVTTPDRSFDIMVNRWFLYQTLVCRVWARAAFYQSSGAYGFRDQLQDGMALSIARPALAREHLVRAAGRQFREGDVQHWWLPPRGQGVRTRISDDRIWLAYATAHYVGTTGDAAVLDVSVPFLEGAKLAAGEHDAFFEPALSDESATLFEHCARGLDASLALGEHGLPLIGTGDWNDGMNRVGEHGHGESVWLAWFLHATLTKFAPIAAARGESAREVRWLAHAATLLESLERAGWDGAWYRRGYFDDGTAFGSAADDECRIDSIAQSWSVIAGVAQRERAAQAMAAVDTHLIRRDAELALLFAPPFDLTARDPGYVKGYPPGIRENGGQYTHAAAWSVIAFSMLGDGDKAAALFAMLNPINRAATRTGMRRYKVEPYVVAADVYSVAPHVGRGGWTWYTGSAAWLYRAGVESILGLHKQGEYLLLTPCIPKHWPRCEIRLRHASSRYEISVENPRGVNRGVERIEVDGVALPTGESRIALVDDGGVHRVQVTLGQRDAVEAGRL